MQYISIFFQFVEFLVATGVPALICVAGTQALTNVTNYAASSSISEGCKIIAGILQEKKYGKRLTSLFLTSVENALNDGSLKLDEETRQEIFKYKYSFLDIKKFIDTLDQINWVSSEERDEKSTEILLKYIKDCIHSVPDEALNILVQKFKESAFGVTNEYMTKNPEVFRKTSLAALSRMEKKLDDFSKQGQDYENNVQSIRDAALFFHNLEPDINEFLEIASRMDVRFNEINAKLDIHTKQHILHDTKLDCTKIQIEHLENKVDNVLKQCVYNSNIQIEENGNISDILENYVKQKLDLFNKTKWPYDINENSFIEIIDIANGDLLDITSEDFEKNAYPLVDCNCISYIEKGIHDNTMICVGYYGMGKSTISKMLFKKSSAKKSPYPIFLNLSYKELANYCNSGLDRQVEEEIKNTLPKVAIKNREKFRDEIKTMIDSQKLLLILDGVDESIIKTTPIICTFIKDVTSRNGLVFLTCRLEFTPFFDAIAQVENCSNETYLKLNGIRLLNWRELQWKEYEKGLLDKHPEKKILITNFIKDVMNEKYKELPVRPLFFKMLSDLIINNETEYKITLDLESNLSEIYYKFICWKIFDDVVRRSSSTIRYDNKIFVKEGFLLLRDLSLCQYEISLDDTAKDTAKGFTLETINKICNDRKFQVIKGNESSDILLYSSLFSIIRRHNDADEFIFSHKSFMEYLVAHNIAEGLLTEKGRDLKPKCNNYWSLFQTKEVSDHLMKEIERIMITYDLNEEERDNMLLNAFQSALEEVKYPFHHDPRIEEILYYIGKFYIKSSPIIINYLKNLTENQETCPEDYYRTASITLSRVVDRSYCENYVLGLLDDLNGEGKRFERNQVIQLDYYGKANLRRTLKRDIDEYIAGISSSCIISLKILTYFTTIPLTTNEEISEEQNYLGKVFDEAEILEDKNIKVICSRITNNKI